MLKDLIIKNRSYRRFYEDQKVDISTLYELVDLARLSPTGGNSQPLRFYLSNELKTNSIIFPTLSWAGYLKEWKGPVKGERPSAYIIILGDTKSPKSFDKDAAIAAQSILLGAVEKDLGGCMIGSVKRVQLVKSLDLPEHLSISLIIAIGKPKEIIQLDDIIDNDYKYWRDEQGIHHVPKRKLEDLIIS